LIEAPPGSGREKPKTAAALHRPGRYEELLRVCLVPLFVVLCYQFEWGAWRFYLSEALIPLLQWSGAPAVRLTPDIFTCNGGPYRIVISCTALDAFFGSLPLLWQWRRPVSHNLLYLAAYFLCLSAANLARLELGFVLNFQGLSWRLAHEAIAGVFYFALFLWIARQRGWVARALPPP